MAPGVQFYRFCVWFSVEQHFAITVAEKVSGVAHQNQKTDKPSMFIVLNQFDSQMTAVVALLLAAITCRTQLQDKTHPMNMVEFRGKIAASFSFR
jgi:hypothetical protein